MGIQAVVFDIGNVLEVNPRSGWPERWANKLRISALELEQRLSELWAAGSVGQASLGEIERDIAVALELEDAALRALMDDMG